MEKQDICSRLRLSTTDEGRYITQLLVAGGEAKPERASQAPRAFRFNLPSPLVY